MKKLNKDSRWHFSTQLIVVFIVACLVAALSAHAWMSHFESDYLVKSYHQKSNQSAAILARASMTPIVQNDLAELEDMISAIFEADPSLVYTHITNTKNLTLLEIGSEQEVATITPEHLHRISTPVIHSGSRLGNIDIVWDSTLLYGDIGHYVNLTHWVVIITVALLSMVLYSSLTRLVTNPVTKINQKLRAISNGHSTPKITQNPFISKEFSFLSHIANRLDVQYQEQLETQRKLAIARDKAEAANTTKNEFLGVVSHELRTPINGVLGLLELLMKDKSLTREQSKHVNIAHASADSLLGIVSNILDFSDIEAGKLTIKHLDVNLHQLTNEVVSMVSTTADKKGIKLSCEIAANVPDNVMGDPVRIRQVLSNLLLNAIKFTEQGNVWVKVECLETTQKTATLRFSVKDTGIGITPEQQEQLFSSFYQGDTSSTREHGGTGLGLAIAHKLVTAMSGNIAVDSTPGQGSTFCFTVPLDIVMVAENQTNSQSAAEAVTSLSGKVLLVEDNPVNKMVATKMLNTFGLEVVHAEHGGIALEQFKAKRFDVVLMDIQMPEMDGYSATLAIRDWENTESLQATPIIALTANVLTEDRTRCFEVGMDDFLAKPIKMNQLHDCLEKHISQPAGAKAQN